MDYRVIKENDLFLLTDLSGDVNERSSAYGLYMQDTRFLSKFTLTLNGQPLNMLVSNADENYISRIVLTNPKTEHDGVMTLWPESIEVSRTRFIYDAALYEGISLTNFSPQQENFELELVFDADFSDMFVIRGFQNGVTGKKTGVHTSEQGFDIGYQGEDQESRKLLVRWSRQPEEQRKEESGQVIRYVLDMQPGETMKLDFFIAPVIGDAEPGQVPHDMAIERLQASYDSWGAQSTSIQSDLPVYNQLYERGLLDVRVLLTDMGKGQFPVAGLPWYAVPFGRDSLIAALQLLPVQPEVAKGTIRTMAHYQGEKVDPWRDEEPGKIMHELRNGELANTNQVPFNPYYGSIDSTPLFLVLIGEYVKWTDDYELLQSMLPHIRRALQWIDEYGVREEEGSFVAYAQQAEKGIPNQGWKDSGNSIVCRDGRFAKAPISLVEVQGYVYQAKRVLAELLNHLKEESGAIDWKAWAAQLHEEAAALQHAFEREFWIESDQFYALALEEDGRRVETVTSNPGHVLMSGIISQDRAQHVVSKLLSPTMFSGYGIRTMAEGEMAFNPMSYHNGSIWPHDNSICLLGMNDMGFQQEAAIVMEGLLKASTHFEHNRLPELFCGYSEEQGPPVRYPVACSPQAWAAATPLVFVQVMLGMRLDYSHRLITLNPVLPNGMTTLSVEHMRLGSGVLDITVSKTSEQGFSVQINSNTTGWDIVVQDDNQ